MRHRFLRLYCSLLSLLLVSGGSAQDLSNIWNAAKRVKLGLDKPGPTEQVGGNTATNPLSPPNTPDIQIFSSSGFWESTNSIGVNFSHPRQLMVSTNGLIPGVNPVVEQTWAFSTDGGYTWPNSLQSENIPPGIIDCYGDPVAFFDRNDRAYFFTLGSPGGIYLVSTTDFGATWSPRSNADVLNSTLNDKEHATADYSGTFPDNIYAAWTDFNIASSPVVFARSTNQGATWEPRIQLAIGSNRGQGAHIAIGPGGEVYVVWAHYTTGTQEAGLGFAKSTDGGATFSTPIVAYLFTGIRISNGGIPQLNNTRAASFPYADVDRSNGPRHGWIYSVHPELVDGQADIFLHRSTDGGTTWSSGIRVNGPDVEPGKWQWLSSVAVDPASGRITVSYFSMDSVGNNFLVNRYAASSIDGGDTWDNFVVSDVRTPWAPQGTPNTSPTYNGDYYETAAMSNTAWPCWSDRRSGINRAYEQPVVYSTGFGWVKGTVTNLNGGTPLRGAYIDFVEYYPPGQWWGTTDSSGFYLVGATVDTPGTTQNMTLRARKFGFRDTLLPITLVRNDTLIRNFSMTPRPTGTLLVRTVRRDSTNIRAGVTMFLGGAVVVTGFTDSLSGIFATSLPAGTYDVLVDPPSPYGSRRFNSFVISPGSNPLYVVVRKVIEYSPDVMSDTLAMGQIHSKILTLTNTTGDTVPFRLSDESPLGKARFNRPAVQPRAVPINLPQRPKGAPDTEFGTRPSGGGGPDAFGYRWIDSDSIGGGVTYNWVEISAAGTPVTTWSGSTDDGSFSTTLPWPFPFYGNAYTTFFMTTNGWLGFNAPSTQYANTAIPSVAEPNNAIYAWWDDLQAIGVSGNGTVYYYNDITNSRYIIEYNNVRHLNATTDTLKFEAILKPNGEILLQYNHMVSPSYITSATIGIENADGSVGLQVVYNAAYVHDNLAVRIFFPDAPWLSEWPYIGRLAPGETQDITITFDATNLPTGLYQGRIILDAVHPDISGPQAIPAWMLVRNTEFPILTVEPTSIDFGNVEIGRTDSSKSVVVTNWGLAPLTVTNVTFTGSPGFSVDRTVFTLFMWDSLTLRLRFSATAPAGERTAVMHFVCNDPNPPSVSLHAVSAGPSHMVVRPDSFYFSMPIGHDTVRTNFRIINTGADTLHYQIRESNTPRATRSPISVSRSRFQHPARNLPKGAIDPTPGEVDTSGGPDAFGYRWIDSDSPGGPIFDWVDISTVGTQITSWMGGADDGYATIPLPFPFCFYGTTFSGNINVCTNGFLSFTSTMTSFTNLALPNPTAPLNSIFPFWDDLNLIVSGSVYYYYDAANNRFIVEYLNVPHYTSGGPYTFELILRGDGTILFQYLTMDLSLVNSATIGIQNGDGTIGLLIGYNANYLHNALAILITTDLIPWMSTDRTSGTVAPGDSTTVALRIHPSAPLTPGDYLGYQRVTSNAQDTSLVRVGLRALPGEPWLTVISPNGGEQWYRGQMYPISWANGGEVDTVKIEFSTSGSGGPWTLIAAGVPARFGLQKHPKHSVVHEAGGEWDNPNGTYNWLIPFSTSPSTNCFVRISWKSNPTINDMSNTAFTIGTTEIDTSWVVQTSGTTTALYCVKAVDANVGWTGGGTGAGVSGFVRRTTNGGFTWAAAGTFTGDVFTMTAIDANTAIAANYTALFARLVRTTDGGMTWATVDSVAGGFYDGLWMFDANNGIAIGDPVSGRWIIKKTTNGGATWTPISPVLPQGNFEAGWNNALQFIGGTGWFGTNNSRIYKSTDFGSTWTFAGTTFVNSYSLAFATLTNGLAGSDTGPFDKSTDGGNTWTAGPASLAAADLSLWANPGGQEFWCTSGNNVYYSSNFGTSWSASPRNGYTGSQQANHISMFKSGSRITGWMVGNAGTIVRYAPEIYGVDTTGPGIPTTFALSQNYPNPFNPTTRITYDLPEQAVVILKVYNMLGQEVVTLMNNEQPPGYHGVTWDGRNNFGVQVSSGVYFYRLVARGLSNQAFTAFRKMLILK